jgi:hypothetical protein
MAAIWRDGIDAGLERTVIARRTSEQELDLLMLLEPTAPEAERARPLPPPSAMPAAATGETSAGEIIGAVSDWIASDIRAQAQGRDKFMAAVAMNALGIVRRELERPAPFADAALAHDLLAGRQSLATPGLLARLRRSCLDKLANDSPKYPALPLARAAWGDAG